MKVLLNEFAELIGNALAVVFLHRGDDAVDVNGLNDVCSRAYQQTRATVRIVRSDLLYATNVEHTVLLSAAA